MELKELVALVADRECIARIQVDLDRVAVVDNARGGRLVVDEQRRKVD